MVHDASATHNEALCSYASASIAVLDVPSLLPINVAGRDGTECMDRGVSPHVFWSSRRPSPSALLPVLGTDMVLVLALVVPLPSPEPGAMTGEMTGSRL